MCVGGGGGDVGGRGGGVGGWVKRGWNSENRLDTMNLCLQNSFVELHT